MDWDNIGSDTSWYMTLPAGFPRKLPHEQHRVGSSWLRVAGAVQHQSVSLWTVLYLKRHYGEQNVIWWYGDVLAILLYCIPSDVPVVHSHINVWSLSEKNARSTPKGIANVGWNRRSWGSVYCVRKKHVLGLGDLSIVSHWLWNCEVYVGCQQ